MFVLPELQPSEIIIYLRKSRTDDPSLTVSEVLSKHEQMLDDFSQRTWGALIPEQNRFREVVSGETIKDRPEINKVLRLIEQDCYKAILIVEPQRLSRGDLEDIGRLSKLLRYTNTIVITLQYSYDLSDERDRDFFERELKRGNEFLEYLKRIMHNGLRVAVENGNYLGSSPPYGYRKISIKQDGKTIHTLEPIPGEAEIVTLIYNMYADGIGVHQIATRLNGIGIKPQRNDHWSPPTLYRILRNEHYLGKVRYYSRAQKIVVEDGAIRKSRPTRKNPEIYDGFHDPIINEALWERVQVRISAEINPPVKSDKGMINPLAGLVYCKCGRSMVLSVFNSGNRKPRLYCPNSAYCETASCFFDDVLKSVTNAMRQELQNITVKAQEESKLNTSQVQVKTIERRIEELKKKEESIWERYAEGMPKRVFENLLEKNARELEAAENLLSVTAENAAESHRARTHEQSLYDALKAIEDGTAPVKQVNELLKACIERVTFEHSRPKNVINGTKRTMKKQPVKLQIAFKL